MKSTIRLFVACFVFALGACGSSVEAQQESWKKSQEAVVQRSEELSAFKPYLDARLEKAKAAWEEASGISDDKEKIEALKAANGLLNPLLKDLVAIDQGMKDLSNTINNLRELRLAGDDDAKRIEAIQDANTAYTEVSSGIYDARPQDDESASQTASELASKIKDAQSDAEGVLKKLKPDTKTKPSKKSGKKK